MLAFEVGGEVHGDAKVDPDWMTGEEEDGDADESGYGNGPVYVHGFSIM